jgi:hypothetical protein
MIKNDILCIIIYLMIQLHIKARLKKKIHKLPVDG